MHSSNFEIELIVAAAGVGKRMGLGYPKQFLEVEGEPLFLKVLKTAEKIEKIKKIIVVTGKESIEFVKEICKKFEISKNVLVIEGGTERQYSIEKALAHCSNNSIIAVQDGVRPFMKYRYFKESIDILEKNREIAGVVIGVPLKDTIKKVDKNGYIVETPKRSDYIAVQTPQLFKAEILKKAYLKAKNDDFLGTDDASLVERIGGKIKFLEGDYENIKITTKEDLKFL